MAARQFLTLLVIFLTAGALGNDAARRLFDDLLSNYNKLVRPVKNHTQTLQVRVDLKLSQLLDVHEKEQILKTNVWLRQEWYDHKLTWNPEDYDGIDMLYVPSSALWTPDIVLYNTAGGHYEITIMTKAIISYTGKVVWQPPAVYHSMCEMDVMWFPFDQQQCKMKFGTWSNDGFQVDLIHYDSVDSVNEFVNEYGQHVWRVENGIDLSDYHPHVEWDILEAPGERHFIRYPCCEAPFVDVTYYLLLRRKTLFYTVNLIIPCVGISCLTVFVFYLPADSGEKIVMCISILISLNALFLLLVEIIPSTSIVMPLIVRYLLFTMILVTLSVAVTVVTLSIHYRGPSTHRMPKWIQYVFLYRLPPLLGMQRPSYVRNVAAIERELDGEDPIEETAASEKRKSRERKQKKRARSRRRTSPTNSSDDLLDNNTSVVVANCADRNCVGSSVQVQLPRIVVNWPEDAPGMSENEYQQLAEPSESLNDGKGLRRAASANAGQSFKEQNLVASETRKFVHGLLKTRDESKKGILCYGDQLSAIRYVASSVALIAHKILREAKEKEVIESWCFVAMVIDRLFLYIFAIICVAGTCSIIFQAPSLYDTRKPIA